ncbi:MAG TPA: oxidoreductase [Lactobacillus sp.]|nr:oxidoreductase [Lactobacillus sp.]
MNELIKVEVKNNQQVVSARELHKGLGVKTRFSQWVEQNFKMFVKGEDFLGVVTTTPQNRYGGTQELQDYAITLNMAEHVAMMSKTEMGSIYRQYFIDLEKKWNDPKEVVKRGYEILQSENNQLRIENDHLKPKALFADTVAASDDTILVRDLAKFLRQNGINIGQNRLFNWLRDKGYLIKKSNGYTPTQKAMDLELFEVSEWTISNNNGKPKIKLTTRVTGKGQNYFVNKFLKANEKVEA